MSKFGFVFCAFFWRFAVKRGYRWFLRALILQTDKHLPHKDLGVEAQVVHVIPGVRISKGGLL
eukprot:3350417-Amphidinium_carterae.2